METLDVQQQLKEGVKRRHGVDERGSVEEAWHGPVGVSRRYGMGQWECLAGIA